MQFFALLFLRSFPVLCNFPFYVPCHPHHHISLHTTPPVTPPLEQPKSLSVPVFVFLLLPLLPSFLYFSFVLFRGLDDSVGCARLRYNILSLVRGVWLDRAPFVSCNRYWIGAAGNQAVVVSTATGRRVQTLAGHSRPVTGLAIHHDNNQQLITSSLDGSCAFETCD